LRARSTVESFYAIGEAGKRERKAGSKGFADLATKNWRGRELNPAAFARQRDWLCDASVCLSTVVGKEQRGICKARMTLPMAMRRLAIKPPEGNVYCTYSKD
jgi:hypothetical protein